MFEKSNIGLASNIELKVLFLMEVYSESLELLRYSSCFEKK